jgi:predicted transcriptional regulator
MESVATSVRVAGDAIRILSDLSEKLGQSRAQVIEKALKELDEKMFWAETKGAFARIAADPIESEQQRAEAELWDRGTAQDFAAETW